MSQSAALTAFRDSIDPRNTKIPAGGADEKRLVADLIELARQYGRYGYRRIAALLRDAGGM